MPNYALNYYRSFNTVGFCFAKVVYCGMSQGNIQASRSHSGQVRYYLRQGECTGWYHSPDGSADRKTVLAHWKTIERNELHGNKALGIRGRHDAQVRTNYMMTMPNELSSEEVIARVRSIIDQTPIRDCVYTICVHSGRQGEVAHNSHVHLLVNERSLVTGKKVRSLSQKAFLEQLKGIYRQAFAVEFARGREVASRERIASSLWKASPSVARELCEVLQQGKGDLQQRKGVGISADNRKLIGEIRRRVLLHTAAHASLLQQVSDDRFKWQKIPDELSELRRRKAVVLNSELMWERGQIEKYEAMKKEWASSSWIMRSMTAGYKKNVLEELKKAERQYAQSHAAKSSWFDQQIEKLMQQQSLLQKNIKELEEQERMTTKEGIRIHQLLVQSEIVVHEHVLSIEEKKKLVYDGHVQISVADGMIRIGIDDNKQTIRHEFFDLQQIQQIKDQQHQQKAIEQQLLQQNKKQQPIDEVDQQQQYRRRL